MRLPALELEHTASAYTRRQISGGTIPDTGNFGGPQQGSSIGLSIVIPLVAGFGGIVMLSSIFLAWFTFRRRRRRGTTSEQISTERIRLGAKKKLPVLSIPVLGLLPIVKFETADLLVSSVEKCADLTAQEEEKVDAVGISTATNQSRDNSPEAKDQRILQYPEPVHLDSSYTSNPVSLPEEDYTARTTSSDDHRTPWRGESTTCTICEEDFQVGQDVRLLPCNHGYHPPCVDFWLLNRSATCPLCRSALALTTVENVS